MNTPDSGIWVVLCSDDRGQHSTPEERGEPIVMETPVNGATREAAAQRAASLEKRFGACRIARLVFEDDPRPDVTFDQVPIDRTELAELRDDAKFTRDLLKQLDTKNDLDALEAIRVLLEGITALAARTSLREISEKARQS